jgi:arylsulfatase A-like enzyme
MFMPDQLRADACGPFGAQPAMTPNLDSLAARGVRFAQAYSQHSVCSQSRASIFTGWYPHVAGHRTLTNLLKPWEPNLLRILKDSGYHVAWAGARGDTFAPGGTAASTNRFGFTTRPSPASLARLHEFPRPHDHKLSEAFYIGRVTPDDDEIDPDEATVRTAEEWLAEPLPEPWVLLVALFGPHPPFAVGEPWFSMHARADVPRPVTPIEAGKARFVDAIRNAYGTERLDPDDWAEIIATYYGMVSRVDDHLGRVVRALDRSGATERTMVAFFTDHGEYRGDYGLVEKWMSGLDDCLLRNPLVIAGPDVAAGERSDTFVELIDLLPTLLDMADAAAPHTHFGRTLVPALHDPATEHRDAAFSEGGFLLVEEPLLERAGFPYHHKAALQHDQPELAGRSLCIRTPDHTYVHRLYEEPELYDRHADPDETANLAGRADVVGIERALRDRLLDWLVATSDVVPLDQDPRFEPDVARELLPPEWVAAMSQDDT